MAVLRRGFLLGVPGALALPLVTRIVLAQERGQTHAFAGLEKGSALGPWVVEHVGPLARGGRVLLLRGATDSLTGDGRFEVEVLLRDPTGPKPPGESKDFAVFVRNSGNGSTTTVEDHGLAAMTLASHLRAHEAGIDHEGWLTMRERTNQFASELDGRRLDGRRLDGRR